jgi:hypothetical protein
MTDITTSKVLKYTWNDRVYEVTPTDIADLVINKKLISLIKIYRNITKRGLRESRDAITKVLNNSMNPVEDMSHMLYKAAGLISDPYTKEEFLFMVEQAIDNMHYLQYKDMLDAVSATLDNVRKNGGLEELARQRDNFLERI